MKRTVISLSGTTETEEAFSYDGAGEWVADTTIDVQNATTDFVEDAGDWIAETASDAISLTQTLCMNLIQKKARFAESIPFATPTDYTIRITWNDTITVKSNFEKSDSKKGRSK